LLQSLNAIARGDELRSFAAKKAAAQDDNEIQNLQGEKKIWQNKSYTEKNRGRRFSAA
jgi:hypothetical protein